GGRVRRMEMGAAGAAAGSGRAVQARDLCPGRDGVCALRGAIAVRLHTILARFVMARVAGHPRLSCCNRRKTWIPGTSSAARPRPGMTMDGSMRGGWSRGAYRGLQRFELCELQAE